MAEGTDSKREWLKSRASVIYFVHSFVWILNATEGAWVKFLLWPAQVKVLKELIQYRLICILKARQLGFTWLVLAYCLWKMLYFPICSVGLFSKGDREAQELLDRLRKMHERLPKYMQSQVMISNAHTYELKNGSIARALPTTGGESFTFSVIFCDEISRFDNAAELLIAVKPTIDAGGQMIIGSIIDKARLSDAPAKMMRAAYRGENDWKFIFMAWDANPNRDEEWYRKILDDAVARHAGDMAGATDEVYTQYPKTPEQAFAPRAQNKRIPFIHLEAVYEERLPIEVPGSPSLPGLRVYRPPEEGRTYVLGCDPAEGVSGSDPSSVDVLDADSGEQVAHIAGLFEPKKVFPQVIFDLALWYNGAAVMVERNNHGHATIGGLSELISKTILCKVVILKDPADGREGWLTSPSGDSVTRGKVAMYNNSAQQIKDGQVLIHDPDTLSQLGDIALLTLRESELDHDDCATSFSLSCCARVQPTAGFSMFRI